MAEIVVLGGSFAGLSTAAMLSRRGHQVTVIERDDAAPSDKDSAALTWARPSTPQLRHSHVLVARGVRVLRTELPDVYEALLAHGANLVDVLDFLPPPITDREPRPGDDRIRALCCRRPVLDWALNRMAKRDGLRVVRDVARGLLLEGTTVLGVATDDGSYLADVVVDASGRRSRVPRWLGENGLQVAQERSPCGCMYLTRAYSLDGSAAPAPFMQGFGTVGMSDTLTALVFRGDGDTFTISMPVDANDLDLLVAREPEAFTAIASLLPWTQPWVEAGRPLADVAVMAGLDNTSRRLVKDGVPLVSGLLQVGDSAATTNPTLGRGMSLALVGAELLCQVLETVADPRERAVALDELRREQIDPFVAESWGVDERGRASVRQRVFGEPAPPLPPHALAEEVLPFVISERDVWERMTRKNHLLALPSTLYGGAEGAALADRVLAARANPFPAPPAPATREQCLEVARVALI